MKMLKRLRSLVERASVASLPPEVFASLIDDLYLQLVSFIIVAQGGDDRTVVSLPAECHMQLTPTAGAAGVNGPVPMWGELATRASQHQRSNPPQVETAVHAIDMGLCPPASCRRLQ
jgi:hypothetical protein